MTEERIIYENFIKKTMEDFKIEDENSFRVDMALLIKVIPRELEELEEWNKKMMKVILRHSTLSNKHIEDLAVLDFIKLKEAVKREE